MHVNRVRVLNRSHSVGDCLCIVDMHVNRVRVLNRSHSVGDCVCIVDMHVNRVRVLNRSHSVGTCVCIMSDRAGIRIVKLHFLGRSAFKICLYDLRHRGHLPPSFNGCCGN